MTVWGKFNNIISQPRKNIHLSVYVNMLYDLYVDVQKSSTKQRWENSLLSGLLSIKLLSSQTDAVFFSTEDVMQDCGKHAPVHTCFGCSTFKIKAFLWKNCKILQFQNFIFFCKQHVRFLKTGLKRETPCCFSCSVYERRKPFNTQLFPFFRRALAFAESEITSLKPAL